MNRSFKYSLIASAIVGLGSNYALAQEAANTETSDETEVIEVKGLRGNLQSAQSMKMEGDTFLDAISAEDMGSLPDRSVLEAISRLPGVAIERFAAADDPDHFGVEGGGVVVRGLTHVRSEFNHRDSFSADSARGLSFEDVSPELMGSVQVYKNQTADMIEGGIAGTVNLNTRKPFDSNGRAFAFSADLTYTDLRKETAPTFSALYSDIWESDTGRFGFLINYSNSDIKVESDGAQVGLYELQNSGDVYVPRSMRLSKKQDDRGREGFATSLQWENPDKTVLLTGEYIRSKATLSWAENVMEMDDGDVNKTLFPVAGTEFEFDNNGLFENGIITSDAGWRGGRDPGGRYGMRHVMQTRARDEESIVNDYSFNAQFTPNDTWAFQFDMQYVDSTKEIFDISVMGATRAVVGLDVSGSGLPDITVFGPGYDNQADYTPGSPFTDPANHFFRSAMDHVSDNEGTEFASRFDAQYTFDEGEIESVEFGVRYSKQKQTTRQSTYNWGNISEAWTANGPAYYDETSIAHEEISFDNFSRGEVLTVEGGPAFLFPAISLVRDYANLGAALSPLSPDWTPLNERGGAQGYFTPDEINQTEEESNAAYVKINFAGELGGMDYDANIGLRYIKRENATDGFITYPDDTPTDPNDPFELANYLIPDQAAFGNFATEALTNTNDFSKVLPSVNFKLNLQEDLLMRFGYSQAIALPSLGLLRNYVAIKGEDMLAVYDPNDPDDGQRIPIAAAYDRYTASSGNPFLKPMESDNWDLSLEWYFEEAGSLTFSLFYKDLSNYFINGVSEREYTNNGSTQTVLVAGATNGESGSVKGYEIAYQQFFDQLPGLWSGIGVQANYTYINEQGSPNSGLNDNATSSDDAGDIAFADSLPLEGLSEHNANFALLYEKDGLSGRIAYNWRSDYLLTTRDVITTLPIFNEANGQLDASLFYDINDNWKVGIQGTNLNNNITETLMQINAAGDKKTRSWFTSDRRYSVVIRGNF